MTVPVKEDRKLFFALVVLCLNSGSLRNYSNQKILKENSYITDIEFV